MTDIAPAARRYIRPEISVGSILNMLTILAMFAAAVSGWADMKARIEQQDRRLTAAEAELKDQRRETFAVTTSVTELRSDIKHLLDEMARTRAAIERMNRNGG
mgnify:CR=1 FL=1